MHALAEEFGQSAVLTRDWLSRVDLHWGSERLIDISKGIWNPRSYAVTLTIVSDPHGRWTGVHSGFRSGPGTSQIGTGSRCVSRSSRRPGRSRV